MRALKLSGLDASIGRSMLGVVTTGIYPSKYWRDRAEEARAQLEQMRDADAVDAMRLVVKSYEKLAQIAHAKEQADRE